VNPSEGEQLAKKGLSKDVASDVRTVATGGAIQVVGQIAQRSLSFFFGVVFVRLLDKAGYGLYRFVAQILSIAAQLGLAGFNYAAMRFVSRARAQKDHGGVKGALRVSLAGASMASVVVFVLLFVATAPIADFFGEASADEADLVRLLRIGALYVPLFAILQVLRYCTQGYKTMIPSVVSGNIVQPAARYLIGVTVLALGFGVTGAVVALLVSVAIAAVVAGFYLRRMLTDDERGAVTHSPVRPMVRFALPQAGASLLGVQTLGLGIILLKYFEGNEAVGIFGIALSLQGPGTVFLGGIVNIWAPVVSDLHARGEIERLGALYQTINRWIATFSFPVFAALIIMPEVFVSFYGVEQGDGTAAVVTVLALGNLFYTGTGPTGYVISMTGHPGVNFANSALSVALYIGLGAWIVPTHGVLGMAAVDSAVTAFINTLRVIEAKVLVGVQPFGRTFYKPVVATLAGAAVLLLWKLLPVDSLLFDAAGLVVGALVYIAALKMLGIDQEERHVLNRIKKKAIKRKDASRTPDQDAGGLGRTPDQDAGGLGRTPDQDAGGLGRTPDQDDGS
jgi:O-antigen/teichoic acid export membrane protein